MHAIAGDDLQEGRAQRKETDGQKEKQAMITLRGMAEQRLSNAYKWQHFTLFWYIIKSHC